MKLQTLHWQISENPKQAPSKVRSALQDLQGAPEELLRQEEILRLARSYSQEEDIEVLGEIRDWGARLIAWQREQEYNRQVARDIPDASAQLQLLRDTLGDGASDFSTDDWEEQTRLRRAALLVHALLYRQNQKQAEICEWYETTIEEIGQSPQEILADPECEHIHHLRQEAGLLKI